MRRFGTLVDSGFQSGSGEHLHLVWGYSEQPHAYLKSPNGSRDDWS